MGQIFQPLLKSGTRSQKWAIRYRINGKRVWERGFASEAAARRQLKIREGALAASDPVMPRADRVRWEEAEADLRLYYQTTGHRALDEYTYRVAHLTRVFASRRIASIKAADVTTYTAHRQAQGAAAATIRRE